MKQEIIEKLKLKDGELATDDKLQNLDKLEEMFGSVEDALDSDAGSR